MVAILSGRNPVETLLSPKQVAQALKVSESSVKRWCDKGSIATIYTEGGHRRIRLGDLADFARTNRMQIQDFMSMGLVQTFSQLESVTAAAAHLVRALLEGNEDRCNQIVTELYLAKNPIDQICDQVITKALHSIGEEWACGHAQIYQERLGCRITERILQRLQRMLPEPKPSAKVAIGCSSEGDLYCLGSSMVELVLRDAGWRAQSLGENLPLTSLAAAIEERAPQLVWISCSHLPNVENFVVEFNRLTRRFPQVRFAIGGQALTSSIQSRIKFDLLGGSMKDIRDFAHSI